jgi:hypothetical protein
MLLLLSVEIILGTSIFLIHLTQIFTGTYICIEDKKKFIAEMHSNTLIGTIDERKPANGCSGASATHC